MVSRTPLVLTLVLLALTGGCTIVNRPKPPEQEQTQLERRQYQQRDFDTNDVKLVMKAVLNTLQDDGFTVRNAVVDLGLISAVKEIMLTGRTSTSQQPSPAETWAEIFAAAISRGRTQPTYSSAASPLPEYPAARSDGERIALWC